MQAFQWVLEVAQAKGVLRGKVLAIDATTLEANAAMKSMVRRVSGEKWMAYLRRLAQAEGLDDPTDEDLRRFDRKRKDKKVSNAEWASPIDPDSPHHEDEGWPDALQLQGRACRRSRQ